MDEVDSIIIHSLRQLEMDIPPNSQCLGDLSVDEICTSVAICISTINPSLKVPNSVPKAVSQRIEYAVKLASICKELGYKNELGYHTLLYFHEQDLRRLFMFLIENLPKTFSIDTNPDNITDELSLFKTRIQSKICDELNATWIKPNYTHLPTTQIQLLDEVICKTVKPDATSKDDELDSSSNKVEQPSAECLLEHKDKINIETVEKDSLDETLTELKRDLFLLKEKLKHINYENNTLVDEAAQMEISYKKLRKELGDLENVEMAMEQLGVSKTDGVQCLLKALGIEVEKLSICSDECSQKIIHTKNLIERALGVLENLETESSLRKKKILTLKKSLKELKDNYRKKEMRKAELTRQLATLNAFGAKNRSSYTKKIKAILSNEEKQNMEMQKIINDTCELEKEIQSLTRQLDRTFCMTEELFKKESKLDNQTKNVATLLKILRKDCGCIIQYIRDTGVLARDMIEVEDKINVEKSKRLDEITKRIREDVMQIQHEIALLNGQY